MPHYSGRAGRAQVAPARTAEPGCWAASPPARLSLHPEGGGTQAACEGMSTRGRVFISLQFRWADSDLRTFTPSEPLGTAPQVPAARRPFPASPSAAVPRSALLRCPERTGAPSLAPCPFPCVPLPVPFLSFLFSLSPSTVLKLLSGLLKTQRSPNSCPLVLVKRLLEQTSHFQRRAAPAVRG